jgi:hypothetical protein
MTSLVGWLGVDSRGACSIYLASDSRISWYEKETKSRRVWDHERKLFASKRHPDLLGYCGDVSFPSQVLGQITALIDSDLLFDRLDSPDTKFSKIVSLAKTSFAGYPREYRRPFEVVYCTRDNSRMSAVFSMAVLRWSSSRWTQQWLQLPNESGIIKCLGSGEQSISKWYKRWNNTKEMRTSRIVFSAFCDALSSGEDSCSGGGPQLVGLYRKDEGETFGVIYKKRRYVLGVPVRWTEALGSIEWRNRWFERCDGRTLERLPDAQRHTRPRGLGNV